MRNVKVTAFDIPDAWYKVLERIWREGEIYNVGYGSEITETKKLNVTIEIRHPENRPLVDERAPCDMRYVTRYFMEYLWFGEKRADETYTYSTRLRKPIDQIDEAIKRYVEELYDRQVTLVVRLPEDIRKEIDGRRHEPPCLTILDTEIVRDEDGRLKFNLIGYFRSWDAYAGLPANLAGLQLFSEQFVRELNDRGRRENGEEWEEVTTGIMVMHSKNCHIYKRQYPLVEELLKPQKKQRFVEKIHPPPLKKLL